MDDDQQGLAKLAYELSRSALERQERVLDELRARTGTLVAASTIVASFLGAQAAGETGFLTILAAGMFVVSIVAAMHVLLPKENLIFALRGSVLFEEEFEKSLPLDETHRRLAYWLEGFHEANQVVIDRLFFWFRVTTMAVLLQVVLWVTEIAI